MVIQVPKSIRKICEEVKTVVRANYPDIFCIEDCSIELQDKWERICNHELFYQDVNRFIGDVFANTDKPSKLWRY
jgi:hypothetical protein